jgi:hypothetical protein
MMTAIEQQHLKGFTLKNLVVTIIGTASIVTSVMTTYFALKSDIADIKANSEITNRVNDLRLKMLETEVSLLRADVDKLKEGKK